MFLIRAFFLFLGLLLSSCASALEWVRVQPGQVPEFALEYQGRFAKHFCLVRIGVRSSFAANLLRRFISATSVIFPKKKWEGKHQEFIQYK